VAVQHLDGIPALDHEACYRVLRARDARFDGRLFVGVTSTGVYCRPVCPANPAKLENCRFFPSAAAAHEAGFRPCLRCRPETAPDLGSWRGSSNTVARGLELIASGELDGEGASVERLSERLGIGERQLRRLFEQHLGASPIAVAQTRRVLFAKGLIHDTHLSMAEIALASGFGSVRRFNETFQALYGRPPSALRRSKAGAMSPERAAVEGVTVRLRYRPPFDWSTLLRHLDVRAVEGVEQADERAYRRSVREGDALGSVEIAHDAESQSLVATIRFPNVRALSSIVGRIRRVFDLGADVSQIGAELAKDPLLSPLIAARPGLRTPGAWDGFELAVRAVLGQQISVEAARKLAGQLTRAYGVALTGPHPRGVERAFPTPLSLATAELGELKMPGARKEALRALARATLEDPTLFQPLASVDDTVARLCRIRGIGEWTAHYIALRAVREPDAFPASDAGLLRAARENGRTPTPAELARRSERWRPFRAYAAQHLWTADSSEPPVTRRKAS
jgi:AraC family transcriptional regulator of adaptative response / DNA-3-methyladenine glycosylase II